MNGKVFFAFSGLVSDDLLGLFMEGIQMQLSGLIEHNAKARNVLIVFIEVMQNAIHYQKNHVQSDHDSLYIFLAQDIKTGKLTVQSRNLILINEEQKVKERVNYVNSLGKPKLRQAYRDLRKSGDLAHDRGAGLGFLEMRKIASEDLKYEFQPYNNEYHSCWLQVCV